MNKKTFSLKDGFNNKVRITLADFGHIAVWKDLCRVDFWKSSGGIIKQNLLLTPETLETGLAAIVTRFNEHGIDLLALEGNNPDKARDYRFYYRPETINHFEDDLHEPGYGKKPLPAITIEGIPFFIAAAEREDFKQKLLSRSAPGTWIEFSEAAAGPLQTARGHYGFRKDRIVDMFAVPDKGHMAVTTPDLYRSFVPMASPEAKIDEIAQQLPQLVDSGAPRTAYPLYYAPDFYPPQRRHHVNIILKR